MIRHPHMWTDPVKGPEGQWHVMPIKDFVAHEPTEDCICGPRPLPVTQGTTFLGWTYEHHALDPLLAE